MSGFNTRSKKSHCIHGHELMPGNTYVNPAGNVECKLCRALQRTRARNCEHFGGNREKVIQRDGEKCVRCGITRAEHEIKYGRDLTVDHKDGHGRSVPKNSKNNSMENLQTLCSPCHGRKEKEVRERIDRQRICEYCGSSFLYEQKRDRFCSRSCSAKWITKNKPEHLARARRNSHHTFNSTAGYAGVTYREDRRKWYARIGRLHLGSFRTREEAINARGMVERAKGIV